MEDSDTPTPHPSASQAAGGAAIPRDGKPREAGGPEASDEEVAHAHDGAIPEDRIEEHRAHEQRRAADDADTEG